MDRNREALRLLSSGTVEAAQLLNSLVEKLEMPNIPFPTMGGHVFWTDMAEYNGWRLQQNMFTRHARILNDDDVRVAWGSYEAMQRVLNRMVDGAHMFEESSAAASEKRAGAMKDLRDLKELLDMGALTEREYQEKKAKLMQNI